MATNYVEIGGLMASLYTKAHGMVFHPEYSMILAEIFKGNQEFQKRLEGKVDALLVRDLKTAYRILEDAQSPNYSDAKRFQEIERARQSFARAYETLETLEEFYLEAGDAAAYCAFIYFMTGFPDLAKRWFEDAMLQYRKALGTFSGTTKNQKNFGDWARGGVPMIGMLISGPIGAVVPMIGVPIFVGCAARVVQVLAKDEAEISAIKERANPAIAEISKIVPNLH
jgi:hypothetical protein